MKARRLSAVFFLALLLIPASIGAAEVTKGTATAESILLRLSTGLGTVSVGSDDAEAITGTTHRAFARFISGKTDTQSVGAAEKTTTEQGQSAGETVGEDDLSLGDFITLGTVGAEVSTAVGTHVVSEIEAELGGVSLLGGLAVLEAGESHTTAITGPGGSHITRQVSLTEFRALALADFLAALNVNPLDLTCEAIASLGDLLGLDAADCQSLLDAVNGLIDDALDALQDAEDELLAARDALLAAIDAAEASLAGLESQLDAKVAELADLNGQLDALNDQRDALLASKGALESTLDGLEVTEAQLEQQRDALLAIVTGYSEPVVQADRDLVTSCDALAGAAAALCQAALLPSLSGLGSTYGVDLSGLGFAQARSALLAAIDEILAAFDELDVVEPQLAIVSGQIAVIAGQIGDLDSQIAVLDAAIDALNDQIDVVEAAIAALNDAIDTLRDEIDDLLAQLEQLLADLDLIQAADAADATCDLVSDVLGSVSAVLPALAGTLDPIAAQLNAACDDLAALLQALLDLPLVTISGIDITIDVFAREDDPYVKVTGTLGSIQVGNLPPIVVDLLVGSDEVELAQDLIASTLGTISAAIGIDLPVPEITFMATDTDFGQKPDGTWFANGSVTFLRLDLPAGTVTLPDIAPLKVLDGVLAGVPPLGAQATGGAAGLLAGMYGAPVGQLATSFDTPGLTLDMVTFNADGTYLPADDGTNNNNCVPNCGPGCVSNCDGTDGTTDGDGGSGGSGGNGGGGGTGSSKNLPRTGVPGFGFFVPALAFGGAELLRRALSRTR